MNVLFIVKGHDDWLGGVYYIKNIIYSFTQCEKAMADSKIYIYTEKRYSEVFSCFEKYKNVKFIYGNNAKFIKYLNGFINKVSQKLFKRYFNLTVLFSCLKYKINFIYPTMYMGYLFYKNKTISWIPDFQHVHLKEFFSEKEMDQRTKLNNFIAKNHYKLILSSQDAFNDYKKLYPDFIDNVFVVPFVSAIDKNMVEGFNESAVLEKYKINDSFFLVSNQFWMHKNHLTLFKAINNIVNIHKVDIKVVCTGNTTDYRNKEYFKELSEYIKENNLTNNIMILGMIDRKDQIGLFKKAIAIVQPSLFEGWGTVVEDAKTLGKKIILSDIDVHYEQKNDDCIIFPRYDYEKLAEIMLLYWKDKNKYAGRYSYGIKQAEVYGEALYEVLCGDI